MKPIIMKPTRFIIFPVILAICFVLVSNNSCSKKEDTNTTNNTVPLLSTNNATDITNSSAKVGGAVNNNGGATVTERGVCYSISSNPTVADNSVQSGSGSGSFECEISGLNQNTKYYFKAYAMNSVGIGYGEQKSFTTQGGAGGLPTVTTASISNVTQNSATSGGDVTSQGNSSVTARGVCWNTTSNPTTSDPHTTDGSGGGSFTSNITGLTAITQYYVRAYATNVAGTSYGNEVNFTTLTVSSCGDPITVTHLASGGVAPVDKTVTYSTVTNIPGELTKCWITSNLGADHQATAVDDATEASAGWYWQFNRKQGYKHDGSTRTPNTTWITSIYENLDWGAANDPCTIELGSGWRIPTYTEWFNVDVGGGWTDWNGPWNSGLKLHAVGLLSSSSGSLGNRGLRGYYSSSMQDGWGTRWRLYFNSGSSHVSSHFKESAIPLRCIKD